MQTFLKMQHFLVVTLHFCSVTVPFPGCFADMLHPWLDQSKSCASFLSYGPQEPEHHGSKSGPLFGCLLGEAALAVAGAIQLWAGHYWDYVLKLLLFCFVSLSWDVIFSWISSLNAEPCGSRWPASPQCLPAEPGLLDCWFVPRKTPVLLPTPPASQQCWCPLLPVRVELARHLRHYCPQCWGHCQRYCLPRILHCFRVSGGGRHWNHQGTGEWWQFSLCYCLCKKWLDMFQEFELTEIYINVSLM